MFKQKECQNKKGDKILCKEGKEAKIRKQKDRGVARLKMNH